MIVGIVVGLVLWSQNELQVARLAKDLLRKMSRVTLSAPRVMKLAGDDSYRLAITSINKQSNNQKKTNTTPAIFDSSEAADNNKLLYRYWLGRELKCLPAIQFAHEDLPDNMWDSLPGLEWDPLRDALKNAPLEAVAAKPKAASGKMFLSLDRRKTSRADNDGNDGDDEDDHQPSKAPRAFLKDIAKAKSKTTQRAFVASIDTAVEDIVKNQPPDSVMSVCSQYSTVFGDGAANATAARSVKETILASQKNTPLFIQLCSALFSNKEGEKMTKPKLEKFLGITVSPFIFGEINHHVRMYGPGIPVEARKAKRINVNNFVAAVTKLVTFLVRVSIKTAAVLTKTVDDATYTFPLLYRDRNKNRLVEDYMAHIKATDGHAIRKSDMLEVVQLVCPRQNKSLAALDTATECHGRLNFQCMREWTQELLDWALSKRNVPAAPLEQLNATIEDLRKNLLSSEVFLKSRIDGLHHENHFGGGGTDGPACHCAFYAFGKRDPLAMEVDGCLECGHIHNVICPQCEEFWRTTELIDDMVLQAKALIPSGTSVIRRLFITYSIS